MITTAVTFDHRGRADKNEQGPLEIRVTINRKPYYIDTGIRILRSEWRFSTIVNRPDSDELLKRLQIVVKKVHEELNYYMEREADIDVPAIRKKVWQTSVDDSGTAMLDWFEEIIPQLQMTSDTRKHYNLLLSRLKEFGEMNSWRDLSIQNIYKFDAWLHSYISFGKPLSQATVYNHHKNLRALLTRAFECEIIDLNPYDRLRGKFSKGSKENIEYLTEAEMRRFVNLEVVPGTQQEKAKDLFVFQMYTGLSYADTQSFSIDDYRFEDGVWVTREERIKTGVPYVSHLLPPVVRVLEKYKMKTPKLPNQKYNILLKALAIAANIKINVHSHLARHTFATFMLRNGVSIENVSKMLGHTDIATTQIYAKVLAQSVHKDFNKIARKVK